MTADEKEAGVPHIVIYVGKKVHITLDIGSQCTAPFLVG